MMSPAPRPGPSKKRRLARGIAIASALAAGAALAGGFTLTQAGSATTTPDEAVGEGDVTVTDLVLEDLSSDPADADRDDYDFTFTNTSDEDAFVAVNDIQFKDGTETEPSDQELYDSIQITLDDGNPENNPDGADVDYDGPLAELADGAVSLGPVVAGDTLPIDVTAYTTIERNQDAKPLQSAFKVIYNYAATAEEAASDEEEPDPEPEPSQCDPLGDIDPALVDGCKQLEDAIGGDGGGGGSEPSCDDLEANNAPPELVNGCRAVVDAITGGGGGEPSCEDAPDDSLQMACDAILDAIYGGGEPSGPSCQDIVDNDGPEELAAACEMIVEIVVELTEGGGGGEAPSCADLPEGTLAELVDACEQLESALAG